MREDALLEGLLAFFIRRIFGEDRKKLLERELQQLRSSNRTGHQKRMSLLRRDIQDLERRQARCIHLLEQTDDPSGVMFRQIDQRLKELETKRLSKLEELTALKAEEAEYAADQAVDLLESLPSLTQTQLLAIGESALRRLFEAFRLQVRFNKSTKQAYCRVTLTEPLVRELRDLSAHAVAASRGEEKTWALPKFAHVFGAPGGSQTRPEQANQLDQSSIPSGTGQVPLVNMPRPTATTPVNG